MRSEAESQFYGARESRGLSPMVYFFGTFFRTSEKSAVRLPAILAVE